MDETSSLFVTRKIPHQRRRLFDLIERSRIVKFTYIGPELFGGAREWIFVQQRQRHSPATLGRNGSGNITFQ